MRILAIKWRRLGDTILWTAALEALFQHFPSAEIDVAFARGYEPLFETDPRFYRRYSLERPFSKWWPLTKEMRARRYDLVVNFHASSRSLSLAIASRAKKRVIHHHSREPKNFFSQVPVPFLGKPMSAIERDLNAVRALGWNGASPPTKIFVSPSLVAAAKERLRNLGWRDEKIVIFGARASRPSKQWAMENYADVCRDLPTGTRAVFLFEKDTVNVPGAWSLESPELSQVMGMISLASAFVGSDSGLKHLAAAVGVKTVTIFGPESVGEWHGYDERHVALRASVACRTQDSSDPLFAWCGEEICPLSSHACMALVRPEAVTRELTRVLR